MSQIGHWNLWSVYWLLWLLVGFLVPELVALFTNPDNTLSDQVWRLIGLNGHDPWNFARFFVAAFMVWLTLHFVLGWFR